MNNFPKFAVYIDAENFSDKDAIVGVLAVLRAAGEVSVCEAHASYHPQKWDDKFITTESIVLKIQPKIVRSKNAADINIAIAATNRMNEHRFDAVCVVSSDSDFYGLAQEIKGKGAEFYGVGNESAREEYRKICTEFFDSEKLRKMDKEKVADKIRKSLREKTPARSAARAPERKNENGVLRAQSYAIATQLVLCAKAGRTISYGEVGRPIGIDARSVSQYLDEINDLTNERFGVLLSILVVNKNTSRPSADFYRKAKKQWGKNVDPADRASCKKFFDEECERIYKMARDGKLGV